MCPAVERGQGRLLDVAGELDAAVEAEACYCTARLGRGALVRADKHQSEIGVEHGKRLDRHERVLPRLECPDEEKVWRSVPGRPVGAERVVDAVEDHGDLALIDAVMLHEVLLRLL